MLNVLAQSGGGPGLHNYLNIIIVLLAVSGSVIGWLFRKFAEQRAIREAKLARERQREQMLRTGQIVEDSAPARELQMKAAPPAPPTAPGPAQQVAEDDARRRLQELANRRRAELADMARRAQSGQGGAGGQGGQGAQGRGTSRPPTQRPSEQARQQGRPIVGPQGMVPRSASQQARVDSQEENFRRQREQQGEENAANAATAKAGRKAAAAKQRKVESDAVKDASAQRDRERLAADGVALMAHDRPIGSNAPARPVAAVGAKILDLSTIRAAKSADSLSALRRAFVMAELLKPPLAVRVHDQDAA